MGKKSARNKNANPEPKSMSFEARERLRQEKLQISARYRGGTTMAAHGRPSDGAVHSSHSRMRDGE